MTRAAPYSFDDNHIGLLGPSGHAIGERLVERPRGLERRDWYKHAGQVCRLLNGEPPDTNKSKDSESS